MIGQVLMPGPPGESEHTYTPFTGRLHRLPGKHVVDEILPGPGFGGQVIDHPVIGEGLSAEKDTIVGVQHAQHVLIASC